MSERMTNQEIALTPEEMNRYNSTIGILGQFAPVFVEYSTRLQEEGDSAVIRDIMRAGGKHLISEEDLALSWGVHMLDREIAVKQWRIWIDSGGATVDDIARAFFRLAEAGLV